MSVEVTVLMRKMATTLCSGSHLPEEEGHHKGGGDDGGGGGGGVPCLEVSQA